MADKLTPAQELARKLRASESADTPEVALKCEIGKLRNEAGLTQSDEARAVGTNSGQIGAIEKGRPPRLDIALRLAAFFGKKIEEVWSEASETAEVSAPTLMHKAS